MPTSPRDWDPFRLCGALNAHLRPHPVAILTAARAPDDFHARFSARERRYLFRVVARRAPVTHDDGPCLAGAPRAGRRGRCAPEPRI